MKKNFIKLISLCLVLNNVLTGCTAVVIAGASVAAAGSYHIATDKRGIKKIISDTTLASNQNKLLNDQEHYNDPVKISATAFNGNVLLIGEAGNKRDIDAAIQMAHGVEGTRHVINEIRISSSPLNKNNTLKDTWITSQIKAKLALSKDVSVSHIKVVTEDNIVYLMGIVGQEEASQATDIASNISGVDKVIKLFEYQDKASKAG